MPHPVQVIFAILMVSLLLLSSGTCSAAAQLQQEAAFVGTVIDLAEGDPLQGVVVTAGDVSTRTDASGNYRLVLAPGNYEIHAELPGYIGMSQLYRQLGTGQARVDFEMVLADPSPAQEMIIEQKLLTMVQIADEEDFEQELESAITTQAVYESPETVTVLMPDGGVVEMLMEEYLRGVVPHEMPPSWPIEALKAQAVAARCYAATADRHLDVGADLCTTTHCQVWSATTYDSSDRAIAETSGVVARFDGSVIYAFFHGHCDGHTRNVEDVWEAYVPYLRGVSCPCGFTYNWGHGVGLCQEGARALAEMGWSFDQIIKHYYTGVEIYIPVPSEVLSASVTPLTGDENTVFTFRASYHQVLEGLPPVAVVLFREGAMWQAMALQSVGQQTSPAEFVLETRLPAGAQAFQFYFDDGDGNTTRWPKDGTPQTLDVSDLVNPDPPIDAGVLVQDIVHSADLDLYGYNSPGLIPYHEAGSDGGVTLDVAAGHTTGKFRSLPVDISSGSQAIAANWYGLIPEGSALEFSLRTMTSDGSWRDWMILTQADDMPEGRSVWGDPVLGQSRAVQYEVEFTANSAGAAPILEYVRLVCMDGSGGPLAAELAGQGGQTEYQLVSVLNREEWGADARFSGESAEATPELMVLHDTASLNGIDPAAALRCLEYLQAVPLNMEGLACNYAVDELGNVYEARAGGSRSAGAHLPGLNEVAIGILMLGDFQTVAPSVAMLDSLADLLAQDSVEHEIDLAGLAELNGSSYPAVSAHSGFEDVNCPGSLAMSSVDSLRSEAVSRVALIPPRVSMEGLVDGQHVKGVQHLHVTASTPISNVQLWVDGEVVSQADTEPFDLRWNTTTMLEGMHQVAVVAENDGGTGEQLLTVIVDNTAPTGLVSGPEWSNSRYSEFSISTSDASYVQFSSNWVWEGEDDLQHQPNTGQAVDDPLASNQSAWLAALGTACYGYWYGPYTFDLPTYCNYEAFFNTRAVPDEDLNLARLDVSDSQGHRIYTERDVASGDYASEAYQEIGLPFFYADSTRPDAGDPVGGLEFRTIYAGTGTLALDRVAVFGKKVTVSPSVNWMLDAVEGQQEVLVRLSDEAGNGAETRLQVGLDLSCPSWTSKTTSSATVQDVVSGLDPTTAMWCTSYDGANWTLWQPLSVDCESGTHQEVMLEAPAGVTSRVRFRIADLAGNVADSVYLVNVPLVTR